MTQDKKKKLLRILIPLGVIAVIGLLVAGTVAALRLFGPNRKIRDLYEYMNVSREGETTGALLVNTRLCQNTAVFVDGTWYLPVSELAAWDQAFYYTQGMQSLLYVNDRAFWDFQKGSEDVLIREGKWYLSLEAAVCACRCETRIFEASEEAPARIWLYNGDCSASCDVITGKGTIMRAGASQKEEILVGLNEGTVLYSDQTSYANGWMWVVTEEAIPGYIVQDENVDLGRTDAAIFSPDLTTAWPQQALEGFVQAEWHAVDQWSAVTQTEEMQKRVDKGLIGASVIIPTWFDIADEEGHVTDYSDKAYVDLLHQEGCLVWGMVGNFNAELDNLSFLRKRESRSTAIEALIKAAGEVGLDGFNIDFEYKSGGVGGLSEECGVHFLQFLRELAYACRKEGLVVSVDNYVPMSHTEFYDRKEQARIADYLIMMGYDEHYKGSVPGSTASFSFVSTGLTKTLTEVPAERLILGVPFYARLWDDYISPEGETDRTSSAISMKQMADLLKEEGLSPVWNEDVRQNVASWDKEGHTYQLWIEDEKSMAWKRDLILEKKLAGAAGWRLDYAEPEIWEVLSQDGHAEDSGEETTEAGTVE